MTINDLYEIYLKHPIICTDTRNIIPGSIFFALKGENFNGNEFANQALEKGCSYVIIDEEKYKTNDKFLLFNDVLKVLQELATLHRTNLKIPIIGITGTNGKTTTKELLNAILSTQFNIVSTKGNFNNHIGVPLTILSISDETEIAIVEMGANHPGEIEFLCKIAKPTYGLITNIGKAHLEGFGSFEGVIKTKNELYNYLFNNKGIVFLDAGNPILKELAKGKKYLTYGRDKWVQCYGESIQGEAMLEAKVMITHLVNCKDEEVNTVGANVTFKTNLIGDYNLENILAAICVGCFFGIGIVNMKEALENYYPDNNRSQFIKTECNTIIMDAYNANPSSMVAAINNFVLQKELKKTIILGDMRELGEYSRVEHLTVLDLLNKNNFESVYLIGQFFSELGDKEKYNIFKNVEEFVDFIKLNPLMDSYILIKGSRGIKLEKSLPYL